MKIYKKSQIHTDLLHNQIYVDNITNKPVTGIIDSENGIIEYCVNGQFHREDGPAISNNDGVSRYYLNDSLYTKEEWTEELKKRGIKPTSEYFKNML